MLGVELWYWGTSCQYSRDQGHGLWTQDLRYWQLSIRCWSTGAREIGVRIQGYGVSSLGN